MNRKSRIKKEAIQSTRSVSADGERDDSEEDHFATVDSSLGNVARPSTLPQRPKQIGRYVIVKELGRGGQGLVYRAVHPNLPVELAIKISIRPLDTAAHASLRSEAQILCELDHPNIARVRDLDFHQGRPFVVLDFIRGRSLQERWNAGEVSTEQAVRWLVSIAHAIEFAHRRGVVHLDLKPDNIVIDEHDTPKVIDFGLAKLRDAWTDVSREHDSISGTLQYMSPEQAMGKANRIGSPSDIFSLGAILYHMIVGKPPFEGGSVGSILASVRSCEFDRQSLELVDAPPQLKKACMKAMASEPTARFSSAEEFADAIGRAVPAARDSSLWKKGAVVAAIGVLLIVLTFGFLGGFGHKQANDKDGNLEVASATNSTIRDFSITHIGNHGDRAAFYTPLFESKTPKEEDDILIEAKFSSPVYCFLFAMNPDGGVQLCYPDSELQAQGSPISELRYPPDEALAFGLTDGEGVQAFVLTASHEPLPSFRQWSSTLESIRWPDPSVSGAWLYSNGSFEPKRFISDASESTGARGDVRSKKKPTALKTYLDSMRTSSVDVYGVVFEVEKRDD